MGLSFLAPLFLAGALAVVVPIIVHLTHRQKTEVIEFPSLMFLERVPFRSTKRQRIKNWLLFLLRCAALLLLTLAFARPFIDRPSIAATLAAGAREVVIVIDRSYSMTYGDNWERARAAADDVVGGLGGSDRAALVLFDDIAQLAVRPTADRAVLSGALAAAAPGARPTRYAPALKIAQQLLDETDLPRREVVLITDLQRGGWDDEQDVRLPEGTELRIIGIADPEPTNLAVGDLVLQHQLAEDEEQLEVTARLTNQGPEAADGVEVTLAIDGNPVDTRSVDVGAGGAASVSFDPVPLSGVRLRGTVTAGADPLPLDNRMHFVVQPEQTLRVLLLEHPRAGATDSFYLERALAIGSRPAFRVDSRSVGDVEAAELAGFSLVIVNDAPPPGASVSLALRQFVEEGGGLLIGLGELTVPSAWQSSEWGSVVPAIEATVDREAELGGTLANFDSTHPVFDVFRAPRSGDFTASSFYRYWNIGTTGDDRVLASFDDGRPALVERSLGAGRLLLWTSSLDTYWNNLPREPVFLPFVHQLARYAAGYREVPVWQTAGQAVDPVSLGAGIDAPDGIEITGPDGVSREHSPEQGSLVLEAPGFHELTWTSDSGEVSTVLAVNVDRRESDLAVMDAEEFAAAVNRSGAAGGGLSEAQVTPADREARQALWWYLVLLALMVLAAEGLLANRRSLSLADTTASYAE